jgi:hypothetical protein
MDEVKKERISMMDAIVERRVPRQAYRVAEFADALGLSDQSVWRAIKAGKIRTFKLNAMVLIPVEELDRVKGGEAA